MKTKAILLMMCIAILTSCAGKFGVMKRRYNKGYYVSHTGDQKKQQKPEARKSERHALVTETTAENFAKTYSKQDPDLVSQNRQSDGLPAAKASKKSFTGKAAKSQVVASKSELSNVRQEVKVLSKHDLGVNKIYTKAGDESTGMLILLIILAILIPPLAVYLKNKTIDKWFWITLVLSLLGFFGFFFVYGGLFWLAAAIIAILYVLDAL